MIVIYLAAFLLAGTTALIAMIAFDHFSSGGLDAYPKAEYAFSVVAAATVLLGCAMSIGIIATHLQ